MTTQETLILEPRAELASGVLADTIDAADTDEERAEIVAVAQGALAGAGIRISDTTVQPLAEGARIPGTDDYVFTNPSRLSIGPNTRELAHDLVVAAMKRRPPVRVRSALSAISLMKLHEDAVGHHK